MILRKPSGNSNGESKARFRWNLVYLVKQSDTKSDLTAKKEKLKVRGEKNWMWKRKRWGKGLGEGEEVGERVGLGEGEEVGGRGRGRGKG